MGTHLSTHFFGKFFSTRVDNKRVKDIGAAVD
jgi:hypothetical protein